MPRKEPTKSIDIPGNLDAQPVKKVWDYLTSKDNDKNFLKPPSSYEHSPAMFYILNKSDHELMKEELRKLGENRKIQSIISSQRIQRTQKDQADLRAHFITVNNFIRDSDDKKKFAFKKISSEIDTQKELSDGIALKKDSLMKLNILREKLKSTTDEYRCYETVLEEAVKTYPGVSTVQEVLSRCDALMLGQTEITALNAKKFGEIGEMQKRIMEITKQAELIFVGLKNELTELERSYHKALFEAMRWEKILLLANSATVSQNLEKERIRDGLVAIYRLLCKRRDTEATLLRTDVERIVDFIKDEVQILREGVAIYHSRQNQNK